MYGGTYVNTCNRCNRPLKDSASVKRGYGPKCWKKVQLEDEEQRKIYEPCTIAYAGLANHTMREIRKRVLQGDRTECRACGEPLETGEIQSYDHDGGLDLKGFGQPQWVYHQCSKCKHQLSIWKLRIDLSDLEKLKPSKSLKMVEAV
ncbi:hypothetical protein MSHOH_1474 [Methanosarcina horonobensis HB-1 = JCM 15518]|uniref:Uncharacterized protein n=1 Tax=Methanosarcina horonobensis HB-1 = JCM 15518 TaxID=1434110 RepID=A0A0E3SD44_9EURY|nr:hypothetical protein MSHOH_1474 [Methanosarcina horonobensis HB-1 = JCM 15518]